MADIQPTLHSVLSHSTVLFLLALVLGGFEKEAIAQEPAINRSTTTRTDADNENVVNLLREAAQLIQTGRVAEAEVILRRALAAAPRNADAHNLLGIVLDQRGLAEEAEREYRTVLRLNPKAISALANLGVLLAHTKRPVEAIETLESVLRLAPGHPQATINLGLLYASRGEYQRAVDFLARANNLQPQTFDILYQLGVSLYYLKRLDEAGNALGIRVLFQWRLGGFLGEMLNREDISDESSVESVLTDHDTIYLAEALGFVDSTGAMRLRQGFETVSHFDSEQASEEMSLVEAGSVARACVQYIFGSDESTTAIDFTRFRVRVGSPVRAP